MKRILIIGGVALCCTGAISLLVMYCWIRGDIKANIELAQQKYGGGPEDALIGFLMDESNSKNDQTHIAVWTLGQLESKKALPILKELYRDDPKGITCFERHHYMICQYELYKAIKAIEQGQLFSYPKLKNCIVHFLILCAIA